MKLLRNLLLLVVFQTVLVAQSVPATLEGTLIDALSGGPISKATLDLQSTMDTTVRYPAVTSTDGNFAFRNVLPGTYSLTAIRSGYVRSQYGQRGPNGIASTLKVTAGQKLTDVRVSMVKSGIISGRLLDPDGTPVPDAQVHAWKVTYKDGWRTLVPVDSMASNDLGEYRLFGLPPGQYFVTAQPEPRDYIRSPNYAALGPPMPGAVVTSFSAGQGGGASDPAIAPRTVGKDYAPTFYGGTTDEFAATAINVQPGIEQRGMDIVVSRVLMSTIKAAMVDAMGQPIRQARMYVTPIGPNMQFTTRTSAQVTGGRIVISDAASFQGPLPRGSYLVTATADIQGRRIGGQAKVDLQDAPADITITLAAAGEIPGRVVFEGIANPDLKRVTVGLKSTVLAGLDVAPQAVSADGTFTLPNAVAGDYLINVLPGNDKAYVKSIQFGNIDVLNDGLHVGSIPSGELQVVIGMNPGAAAGVARDESGAAQANITVVLLPDDAQRNRIDLYQSGITDAAGRYRFDRVPPGSYKLFAWEDVEKDSWRNSTFMRLYESRGKTITVAEGSSANTDLDIIPIR